VRTLFRWTALLAATSVALGFAFFALDEFGQESTQQIARVDESLPATAAEEELAREQKNGPVRELIEDANDVLLRPFDGVVSSDDSWVSRGVPTVLALLVYGFGGIVLLNYTLPNRR
jgi:hypothetical protein